MGRKREPFFFRPRRFSENAPQKTDIFPAIIECLPYKIL